MSQQELVFYSLPFVSALVGLGTNFLAVRMLFRPRKAFKILGFKIQGLIPRRQAELARKIAQTVEEELISHDDIERALSSPRSN